MPSNKATRDPIDLAGIEAEEQREALTEAEKAKQDDDDFRWLVGTSRGRRIVWRLLGDAGVFRSSFNTNALQMAANEGNRVYGLRVLNRVMALAPEQFEHMLKENK